MGDIFFCQTYSGGSLTSPVTVSPSGLVFFALGTTFYAVDGGSGSIAWTYEANAPITSAAAVTSNSVVFVASNDGMSSSMPWFVRTVDRSDSLLMWLQTL